MKNEPTQVIIFLLSATMLFSSCATLFTGSYQTVRFESNVPDAKVMLNTKKIGETNQDIRIKRSQLGGLIRVSEDGCITKEIELPIKDNPAFYLNMPIVLLFGAGLLFAYIDVALDNHQKTDKVIRIDLDCSGNKKK